MKLLTICTNFFLLLFLLIITSSSFAQENLFAEEQILSINQVLFWDFSMGDLDNDNDTDLITYFYVNEQLVICWHNNLDGLGNFGQQKFIYEGSNIFGTSDFLFLAKDLDGDGDNDFIACSDSMYWFENLDGMGNFGAPIRIPIFDNEHGFWNVYCVDMDGDDDLDIFTACIVDPNVIWIENMDGNGTFETIHSIYDENFVRRAYCHDMDSDGDLDVVIKKNSENSNLFWLENTDGLGSFESSHVILPSGEDNLCKNVLCLDLDSDNDIDIVCTFEMDDRIIWLENSDSQGNFTQNTILSESETNLTSLQPADIDSDNDMDLLFYVSLQSRIVCFENIDGNGNFGSPQTVLLNAHPRAFRISDMDGDGDQDCIMTDNRYRQNSLQWIENTDGQGSFTEKHHIAPLTYLSKSLLYEDMDGDGDNDLLIAADPSNNISFIENVDGSGKLGLQHILSDEIIHPASLITGDLNDDSVDEIITASLSDYKIYWLPNPVVSDQEEPHEVASGIYGINSLECSDLDGDGDNDLLSSSIIDGKFSWYENIDGEGNFGSPQLLAEIPESPYWVTSADLDNDGDQDILGACMGTVGAIWFENLDGNGNFSEYQSFENESFNCVHINAEDIDGDGDLDVITTNTSENPIVWYKNMDGNANFERMDIGDFEATNPKFTMTSDLDDDGDYDLLLGNSNSIYWLENSDGLGNFLQPDLVQNLNDTLYCMIPADIDDDGLKDILYSTTGNVIYWQRNIRDESSAISQPDKISLPGNFAITNIYPNPFNPETKVTLLLQATSEIEMSIFNILGQEVASLHNGILKAGYHTFTFTGENLAGGYYFVKVSASNGEEITKKIVLLK